MPLENVFEVEGNIIGLTQTNNGGRVETYITLELPKTDDRNIKWISYPDYTGLRIADVISARGTSTERCGDGLRGFAQEIVRLKSLKKKLLLETYSVR